MFVNSQLVCLVPDGTLNPVMFSIGNHLISSLFWGK